MSAGLVSIAAIASAADLSEASLRAADAEQMRITVRGDAVKILDRRFTNVFVFEDGEWRFLARQATIVGVR